jgi:hypothetical protein
MIDPEIMLRVRGEEREGPRLYGPMKPLRRCTFLDRARFAL